MGEEAAHSNQTWQREMTADLKLLEIEMTHKLLTSYFLFNPTGVEVHVHGARTV